jgi:hypothetical protein
MPMLDPPGTISFPTTNVGQDDSLFIGISNNGGDTLFIDSLKIMDGFGGVYSFTAATNVLSNTIVGIMDATPDTSIAGIVFMPVANQIYDDTLMIYFRGSSSAAPMIFKQWINGQGQGSMMAIHPFPFLSFFKSLAPGDSDSMFIKIENPGTDTSFVDSLRFISTGQNTGIEFSVTDTAGPLVNSDTMKILLTFTPSVSDPLFDTLLIFSRSNIGTPRVDSLFISGNYNLTFDPGDPSGNGEITAFDASLVLQKAVGKVFFSPPQDSAADVSANGTVAAYDAALILQYAAGFITSFPSQAVQVKPGIDNISISVNDKISIARKGQIVSFPVETDNPKEIFSIQGAVKYDHELLKFNGISFTALREDILVAANDQGGKVKFALASCNNINDYGKTLLIFNFEALENIKVTTKLIIEEFIIDDIPLKTTDIRSAGDKSIPTDYFMNQNYPNPFNPETTIEYGLSERGKVTIIIYNMLGQKVKTLVNEEQPAGYHSIKWNGRNDNNQAVSSGTYIYLIKVNSFVRVKRMSLIK